MIGLLLGHAEHHLKVGFNRRELSLKIALFREVVRIHAARRNGGLQVITLLFIFNITGPVESAPRHQLLIKENFFQKKFHLHVVRLLFEVEHVDILAKGI